MSIEDGVRAIEGDALSLGSGLYIDVENLHPDGQTVIESLLDGWPTDWPAPSCLTLYTRADQTELWRLWAQHRFSHLQVTAHGTQHFSWSSTKNSADIAIAIKAMADLVTGRVSNAVVLSDDSDFISLYVAIRDEQGIPRVDGRTPFLWAVTDRKGPLSTTVEQFFPPTHLHIVSPVRVRALKAAEAVRQLQSPSPEPRILSPTRTPPVTTPPAAAPPVTAPAMAQPLVTTPAAAQPPVAAPAMTQPPVTTPAAAHPPMAAPAMAQPPMVGPAMSQPPMVAPAMSQPPMVGPAMSQPPVVMPPSAMPDDTPSEPPAPKPSEVFRDMAKAVVEELPVGPFKSGDAQAIIRRGWPTHPMARASSGSFGTHFKDRVWPFLETCGVRIPNPNKKPIQYENTAEAKETVTALDSASP